MFPSAVDCSALRTLPEALRGLTHGGEYASLMAGGQSLVPVPRLRFAAPDFLVGPRKVAACAAYPPTPWLSPEREM